MKSGIRNIAVRKNSTRVIAFAFILSLYFVAISYAQSPPELYNQANQFYKSKQFRQAADDYEKLLSQGYKNAEVFYNLGNCYYKMDSVGRSILNYERGLRISPKDEDIIYNLKLARLRSIDNIQPVPQLDIITWWNDFVSFNSSKGWGIFALIAIWISLLVFGISYLFGRSRMLNVIALFFLLLSFSSLALAFHQRQEEVRSNAAIVMASSVYVKSAPDAGASDLFMIHEGTRIDILDQVGEWNKIRLDDGKVGWIEKDYFEKI